MRGRGAGDSGIRVLLVLAPRHTHHQLGRPEGSDKQAEPPSPSALHRLAAAYADMKPPVHCASYFMIHPSVPVQLRSGRGAISFWPNHRLQIQSRGNSKISPVLHHNHDKTLIDNLQATSSAASASRSAFRRRIGTGTAPGLGVMFPFHPQAQAMSTWLPCWATDVKMETCRRTLR